MKYAIVENKKVVNIVIATPEFALEQGWVQCPDEVDIGWVMNDEGTVLPPQQEPDIKKQSATIRSIRNGLLAQSDVYVLADRWAAMNAEQQAAWATYRQALRDVPQQAGFPWEVQWPTKPE